MPASTPRWASELRSQLKREQGFGWSVRERNGHLQLTRRWEDGTRLSMMLPFAWNAFCGRAMLNAVEPRHAAPIRCSPSQAQPWRS